MEIKDVKLRETLERLKHIHDDIAMKKANIIRRMNLCWEVNSRRFAFLLFLLCEPLTNSK